MKSFVKTIAVILAITLLSLTLCSCNELDKMKLNQAKFVKNDSREEIIFRGNIYRLLPDCQDLYFEIDDYGTLTESDVPVLLSGSGDTIAFDKDATILSCDENIYDYFDSYNAGETFYCRSDLYDEMVAKIQNHTLDSICVSSYDGYDLLPKSFCDALKEVILTNSQMTGNDIYSSHLDINMGVRFFACDSTLTFVNDEYLCSLNLIGNEYYVIRYTENYDSVASKVPEKYKSIFEAVYTQYGEQYYWTETE